MLDLGLTLEYLRAHEDAMLADIESFVRWETPSNDKPALDAFAVRFATYAEATGARADIVPDPVQGDHVVASWPGREAAPVLLLGHYDTVWPRGTLATMPFAVADGRIGGPGTFDMKVGLVQGLWAIRAVHELAGPTRRVSFICNSDEEVGSPGSAALIEEAARRAAAVLVLEPSVDGKLKTARKGVGRYRLEIKGRASHAGLDAERGASAVRELCRLALAIYELADPPNGTNVNVGTVRGGTAANVIAGDAAAEIDVRATTLTEAKRFDAELRALETSSPDVRLRVTGGLVVPPMERTTATAALFASARRIAAACGFALEEAMAGGGSDGSRCAAVGAPVLDGLGAVGGGAHAVDEYAEVAAVSERAALVAGLIAELAQ